MRLADGTLRLSATDLANFLGCKHRAALEMAVAHGDGNRPYWDDPLLDALIARGKDHERAYVDRLRAEGMQVVDLGEGPLDEKRLAATREAMGRGAEVIVQGALSDGRWQGQPDLLRRIGTGPDGRWLYEVEDTKLALETRAGTILQLGLYCDLLAAIQGVPPENFHIVVPGADSPIPLSYRVDDYAAYFRLIRRNLEAFVAGAHAERAKEHYPDPVEHCDICNWASSCKDRRRGDDHPSLVAGITRLQRTELAREGVASMAGIAGLSLPLPFRPRRSTVEAYERVRAQASLQIASRGLARPVHELLPPVPGEGLGMLPEPSPGDLFLDIEGDPFTGGGGREYLFGLVTLGAGGEPAYRARWALTAADEATAFDDLMAEVMRVREAHPDMHIYHYAPYEPAALKRLMGRHAMRGEDLDLLLRGGRFIDLYAVVRQGLRAGVERYSIKTLEPLFDFIRRVPLRDATRSLRALEHAIELGRLDLVTPAQREMVQGYNKDDCVSALRLRGWLEEQRKVLIGRGEPVPRPLPEEGEASEDVSEREARVEALRARLLEGIPAERAARNPDQQAKWLLAYLLDWHRREDKASWWEYFRLCELPDEELLDERQAVAGLTLLERLGPALGKNGKPTRSVIDRYAYPEQEMEIRRKHELKLTDGEDFGVVIAVDRRARTMDIRKGPSKAETHPSSAFEHTIVRAAAIEDAIFAIGESVVDGAGDLLASRLLRREAPILRSGPFTVAGDETAGDFAVRVCGELDDSVLPIQGPPGTGKTTTGARMICELLRQGKRVGVTATGHKVIQGLLKAVAERAKALPEGTVRIGHKPDESYEDSGIVMFADNEEAHAAFAEGRINVLGGTAWLWSRPEFEKSADVLFIDEAGQMSLANALAVTRAAGSVVMLGDPQQLEQPVKGTHPEGVGDSALEHMLGPGVLTLPPERGIFLEKTWRLPPAIGAFTSEMFYESRLKSAPGRENQRLKGSRYGDEPLWVIEVSHEGNRSASEEEAEAVDRLVTDLLVPGSEWVDAEGKAAPLTASDILVVAPYNAHVGRIYDKVGDRGVEVGTVDKFQGREKPVVIFSMAASSAEEAPRGMEFLYSLNRLNVATSRARCTVFVVAHPSLFAPECRTPRQMKLANALCRFRELARVVSA